MGSIQNEMATVRIKRIRLKDFKNVLNGEVVFNCGKKFIKAGTKADIIGIYGPNGSGKTAVIDAMSILQSLMSAGKIPMTYADCVAIGADYASLLFEFELQYPDGTIREATYSFCMKTDAASEEELKQVYSAVEEVPDELDVFIPYIDKKVQIFNECLSLKWEKSLKRQLIIDTGTKDEVFLPDSKRKILIGDKKKIKNKLEDVKQERYLSSRSFIFSSEFINTIKDTTKDPVFHKVLFELYWFAKNYLIIVGSAEAGIARIKTNLIIHGRDDAWLLTADKPQQFELDDYKKIITIISGINIVLQKICELTLHFKEIDRMVDGEGIEYVEAMIMARKDGAEYPLRYEAYGVRKIIYILNLLVMVFNQKSTTVAIDEFDEGIFEMLLGEILSIIEEEGKGQFIFTSHNLRPLEKLDKNSIIFTTTDKCERYVRMKGIAPTNNLRDAYLKQVDSVKDTYYSQLEIDELKEAFKEAHIEFAQFTTPIVEGDFPLRGHT